MAFLDTTWKKALAAAALCAGGFALYTHLKKKVSTL